MDPLLVYHVDNCGNFVAPKRKVNLAFEDQEVVSGDVRVKDKKGVVFTLESGP